MIHTFSPIHHFQFSSVQIEMHRLRKGLNELHPISQTIPWCCLWTISNAAWLELSTKDRSGWGFTAKQGVTTVHDRPQPIVQGLTTQLDHENGSSRTCSQLNWTASKGHSQTAFVLSLKDLMSLLQKVQSQIGSQDWREKTKMFDIYLWRFLWMYCSGHARVKGNNETDRWAKQSSHMWPALWKIWSVDGLKMLPAGTKPRTPHHRLPGGEWWR